MTIVYVDLEHEEVRRDPARARSQAAKFDTARSRLAWAAEEPCMVMRCREVCPQHLAQLEPSAVVLSGSTTDWGRYDLRSLEGLLDVIRSASIPILGICAGHQLIGYAHGASWGALGSLRDDELDPDPRFAPGENKERGFVPVDIDPTCLLFRGMGNRPYFFQSHYWHLQEVPAGFVARGHSAGSPIQVIEHLDRPVFGVQFHPERTDADHPDGNLLLRNFFTLGTH